MQCYSIFSDISAVSCFLDIQWSQIDHAFVLCFVFWRFSQFRFLWHFLLCFVFRYVSEFWFFWFFDAFCIFHSHCIQSSMKHELDLLTPSVPLSYCPHHFLFACLFRLQKDSQSISEFSRLVSSSIRLWVCQTIRPINAFAVTSVTHNNESLL